MSNQNMTDTLTRLYKIVDNFREFFANDVQTEMNTMFMTDDFEGLETACGLISSLMDDPENRLQLMISTQETRNKLASAYQACCIVEENTKPDSDLGVMLTNLKACYYSLINFTYGEDKDAQTALNNILEIVEYGIGILDTISSKSDSELDEFYDLLESDKRIHNRLDQLYESFNMLKPKYEGDEECSD